MNVKSDPVAPINWPTVGMFVVTALICVTIVPWYGLTYGYSKAAWIAMLVVLTTNEMAITCGYHRLFAHGAYTAHRALRLVYLLFGAMAIQNSALVWAAGHRVHHKFIDDVDRDPYCAKRGFWFSHLGWMVRNYPAGDPDFSYVRDLERDPLVAWQHRNYWTITLSMNFLVPMAIGWAVGDFWGVFWLAGFLRLVLSHHLTFLINSAAHYIGTQPYTVENTARDNGLIAVLTFGEGYHNFHHLFAQDYRNGVRWWQWDPSKWFIRLMSWVGLAHNLRRVPWFKIQRARVQAQFARAELNLGRVSDGETLAHFKARLSEEYASFQRVVAHWQSVRSQFMVDARHTVHDSWERWTLQTQIKEMEQALRQQMGRMRELCAEIG